MKLTVGGFTYKEPPAVTVTEDTPDAPENKTTGGLV
jgi:hypothetical protein